jgi:hypothetical protein
MITEAEGKKIRFIKAAVKEGRAHLVSNEDKQWILDMLKREVCPIRKAVKTAAKNSGFNVTGIEVI